MRLSLATDYKTRTGNPDKDARQKNSYIEVKNEQAIVRKRPSAQGGIAVGTGIAQGGIGLNINGVPSFIGFWADTMQSYSGSGTSWDAGTAYSIGDHVSYGFVDYWAIEDNTGSQPPSSNWSRQHVPAVGVTSVYATWNPLDKTAGVTLSNGNLTATMSDYGFTDSGCRATISKSSGKWYWEISFPSAGTYYLRPVSGLTKSTVNLYYVIGTTVDGFGIMPSFELDYILDARCGISNATRVIENVYTCFGSNITDSSVLGYALDMDSGNLTLYINGVSQGVVFSGLTGNIFPTIGTRRYNTENLVINSNFGATPFAYSVPSGYNSGLYT